MLLCSSVPPIALFLRSSGWWSSVVSWRNGQCRVPSRTAPWPPSSERNGEVCRPRFRPRFLRRWWPVSGSGSGGSGCSLRWYIILGTKIVPSNINDPRKHLQHRDQRGSTSNLWMLHHGKQVENLMRLLGNSPEPRVLHLSGRERRHRRLLQDHGAFFIHPKQLSPFPERLELPLCSEKILSGYEDVVSSSQDQYTTWVKTDPDVTLERHVVDVQKAVAEFREASVRRHDHLLRVSLRQQHA